MKKNTNNIALSLTQVAGHYGIVNTKHFKKRLKMYLLEHLACIGKRGIDTFIDREKYIEIRNSKMGGRPKLDEIFYITDRDMLRVA
jgi:hypothetical protein